MTPDNMTLKQLMETYVKKYGGFPHFLYMGAPDDVIMKDIRNALKNDKELKPVENRIY